MLREYFTRKMGESIYRRVQSGINSFGGPAFARQYEAEVLDCGNKHVVVNVKSNDKLPTGATAGGSLRYLGEVILDLYDIGTSLEAFWETVLQECDPDYAQYYHGKEDLYVSR